MTKTFYWDKHAKYTFEVPFRCFLPKKVNNLILTGASLSFTYHTIFMVMRNFPWCTQTGEIAGFAAAQCIEQEDLAERTGVERAVFLMAARIIRQSSWQSKRIKQLRADGRHKQRQ